MEGKFEIIEGSVEQVKVIINEKLATSFVKIISSCVEKKILYVTLYIKERKQKEGTPVKKEK